MFAVTADSIFKVDNYACTAVAISSVSCGLGIACVIWFLVRYSWVELKTFIVRTFPNRSLLINSLWLIVPFPGCIWFIHLLLIVLTHAHVVHADLFHLTHVLSGAHCIWRKARSCHRDWGVGSSSNDPPVCCVWDTLLCYICLARLESRSSQGFQGLDFVHSSPSFPAFFLANMLSGKLAFFPSLSRRLMFLSHFSSVFHLITSRTFTGAL